MYAELLQKASHLAVTEQNASLFQLDGNDIDDNADDSTEVLKIKLLIPVTHSPMMSLALMTKMMVVVVVVVVMMMTMMTVMMALSRSPMTSLLMMISLEVIRVKYRMQLLVEN